MLLFISNKRPSNTLKSSMPACVIGYGQVLSYNQFRCDKNIPICVPYWMTSMMDLIGQF